MIACATPLGNAIGVVEAADRVSGDVDALLLLLLLLLLFRSTGHVSLSACWERLFEHKNNLDNVHCVRQEMV